MKQIRVMFQGGASSDALAADWEQRDGSFVLPDTVVNKEGHGRLSGVAFLLDGAEVGRSAFTDADVAFVPAAATAVTIRCNP